MLKFDSLHHTGLINPVLMPALHALVKFSIGNSQVVIKEDGVDIIYRLSSGMELGVFLLKVSVYFVLNCKASELT